MFCCSRMAAMEPPSFSLRLEKRTFQSGCRLHSTEPTITAIMAAMATMKTIFCWLPRRLKASRRRSTGLAAGALPAVVSVVAAINARVKCDETEEESIEKPNFPRNILLLPRLNLPYLFSMPALQATPLTPDSDNKAAELQRAFAMFNQVSAELTHAYEALQARVASLTEELAVANGELRRQYQEKEALSERLSSLLDALPSGVVLLDSSASVVAVNPAAMAMFGTDMVGRHWGDVARAFLEPTLTVGEWLLGQGRVSIAESVLASAGGKILLIHD